MIPITKSLVKRVVSFFCIVILCIVVHKGLIYILVDDTLSYTRIMMHQLYNTDKNIDITFVGSSHVYRSLIPEITDDGFRAHTFNCGTSSQYLDGSLALIEEMIEKNNVNTIYLEMYFGIAQGAIYQKRIGMTPTYIISDYMKPSIRKISYLLHASSKKHWINSFLPERRYWEKLFEGGYIIDLISRKQDESYKKYHWIRKENNNEYYVDRGFVANDTVKNDVTWISAANNSIQIESITNDWNKSLQQIVNTCRKNNVKLVLFLAPMPEWNIVGLGNYDEYHWLVQKKADEYGINFFDFNLLVNNKSFSTLEKDYFMDEDHLNTNGARAFSRVFSDVFTNSNNEYFFYDSLSDKLKDEKPFVYGVSTLVEDQNSSMKTGNIVANRKNGIEYMIEALPEKSEPRVLQDYSEKSNILLPIDEHGILRITYRVTGHTNISIIELIY